MPSWPAPPTGLQTFLRPVKIQINNKRQNNSEIEENKRSCWPFCWMEWLSSICYCMISPYATLHISFFLLLTVCNLLSCYIFTWTVCCVQWTSSMCKYQCSTDILVSVYWTIRWIFVVVDYVVMVALIDCVNDRYPNKH